MTRPSSFAVRRTQRPSDVLTVSSLADVLTVAQRLRDGLSEAAYVCLVDALVAMLPDGLDRP